MPVWVWAIGAIAIALVFILLPERVAQRALDFLTASPGAKLVATLGAIFGFAVVVFTALQIFIDLQDRREERAERREAAIDRAWDRLLRPVPGSTGKAISLNYLLDQNQKLHGVDLSCRVVGRWDDKLAKCEVPAVFEQVEIDGGSSGAQMRTIFGLNLSWNVLMDSQIEGIHLEGVDFRRLWIRGGRIANSTLIGNFSDAKVEEADLTGTLMHGITAGLVFRYVNLSNAAIPAETLIDPRTDYLMAWADSPPRRVPQAIPLGLQPEQITQVDTTLLKAAPLDALKRIRLCDPPAANGATVPLSAREVLTWRRCEHVPLERARTRYPAPYK